MSLKALTFAPDTKRDDSKRDSLELPINGETYFAYRPSTNSIALFFSAQGKRNQSIRLAAAEEFLEKNLEREAFMIIMKAVREDAIEYETLLEMVLEIIEEFAGNPTTSSTASSRSPGSSGAESTANSRRPAARTRVTSRSRASAT